MASSVFLLYAVIGAVMLLSGSLEYGAYSDNLLAIGIACGAIGVPRAISKVSSNVKSANLFGFIETVPIPSLVFVVFLITSSASLSLGYIEFGAFSDNILKVGIACGAIQIARTAEHVFAPPSAINSQ